MDISDRPSLITKFSLFFVHNWRVSILIILAILTLGSTAYTTLLQREGFPAIEVPVALVQTPYFVDDEGVVDRDITRPIEQVLQGIPEISGVQSTTTPDFSNILVEFAEDITPAEGVALIREEIQFQATLPEGISPTYQTFNPGAFDGENDLVFNLVPKDQNDTSLAELTRTAQFVSDEIALLPEVSSSSVVTQEEERTNPLNGETSSVRTGFGRVGTRSKDGTLEFRDAINLGASRQESYGSIDFSDAIQERVQQLKSEGELEGYEVVFGGGDQAISLKDQILDLETNATNGLIAVMVLLIFFVNWRSSLVMAVFVPTVMAATFITLFFLGYTLNTLSLFALILVIGIVADDAIVVIDAIDYSRKQGYHGKSAIVHAINNVGIADISGSVTTILVFAPLAFISGILGDFIRLIPITVITALSLSILIGLSLVPFLGNVILPDYYDKKLSRTTQAIMDVVYFFPRLIDKLGLLTYQFVHFYVQRWWATLSVGIITIALVAGGAYFASQLDFSIFAPAKDTDALIVTLSTEDTSIDEVRDITIQAEEILKDTAEQYIQDITYFDTDESGAFLYVSLSPVNQREITSTTIVENLNTAFSEKLADREIVAEKLGAGPPSDDFQVNLLVFDDSASVLSTVTDAMKESIEDIELTNGEITDIAISGTDTIVKRNGKRYASVQIAVSDPSATALIVEAREKLSETFNTSEFREEYSLSSDAIDFDLGQEGENLESFESAIVAVVIAVLIMYSLLVLQFNSFTQPLLILTAVPLAFPGLFPGLLLTNNPISFFVIVGIVGLIGIVVNNTILLMDFANSMRAHLGIAESISEAIKARFRPLFTTSMTTLVGILPLALSNPFWEPLSYSIIFGLLSSTTLVILAFPVFYVTLEHIRQFVWKRLGHPEFQ